MMKSLCLFAALVLLCVVAYGERVVADKELKLALIEKKLNVTRLHRDGEVMMKKTPRKVGRQYLRGICDDGVEFLYNTEGHVCTFSCPTCEGHGVITEECIDSYEVPLSAIKVVISEDFDTIGERAFMNFKRLETVEIPETVTTIGYAAFANCISMKTIELPTTLTSLGGDFFSYYSDPYGDYGYVFYGCSSLTSITLPSGIDWVSEALFYECTSLKTVVLPESMWMIGITAFAMCGNLTKIDLPDDLWLIGGGAFEMCESLTNITIPASVIRIGEVAFLDTANLGWYEVADGSQTYFSDKGVLYYIGEGSYTLLKYPEAWVGGFEIPDFVDAVGDYAFAGSRYLTNVTLSASVQSILDGERGDFDLCTQLEGIYVKDGNPTYYSVEGVLYKYELVDDVKVPVELVKVPLAYQGEFVVPYTVRNVKDSAFSMVTELTKVTLPDGIPSIGYRTFHCCFKLTNVNIPDSVQYIGQEAFNKCYLLDNLTIPSNVETIGVSAFNRCLALSSLVLPEGVKDIEEGAFRQCTHLISVSLPKTLKSIGEQAFWNDFRLKDLTMPGEGAELKEIGYQAFYGCTNMTDISLPDSVETIGKAAFAFCYSIESFSIPSKVTVLSDYVFSGCSSLKSIALGSVTDLGVQAFEDCRSLQSVDIPSTVTTIGHYCFTSCVSLTKVTIPNGISSFGQFVFSDCENLETVEFTEGCQYVHAGMFQDCSSLSSVKLPKTLVAIAANAFAGCTSLSEISIPNKTQLIFDRAFSGCRNLRDVELSEGLTGISEGAFEDCIRLTSVTLPSSLTTLGKGAFQNCLSLQTVEFLSNSSDIGEEVFKGCRNLVDVTIPTNLTSIPAGAFSGCSSLKEVTIPETVTSIEKDAFSGCTNLTSVTIPCDVESGAFSGCTGLETVRILPGVTEIGSALFEGCSGLTSIEIPETVTTIAQDAFSGLSALSTITVANSSQAFLTDNGVLIGRDGNVLVRCPPGKSGAFTIPENVLAIGDGAFEGCSLLTSLTITPSVDSISVNAFNGMKSLNEINVESSEAFESNGGVLFSKGCSTLLRYPEGKKGGYVIPNGTESINTNGFRGCSSLTDVSIPETLQSVGSYAFAGCESLETMVIPENVKSIGDHAFEKCSSLSKVVIDSQKLDTIEVSAFEMCTNLVNISMPNSIVWIKERAFYGCSNLKQFEIPEGVTWLGSEVFYGSGLKRITIPSTLAVLDEYPFDGCYDLEYISVNSSILFESSDGVLFKTGGIEMVQIPKAWSGDYVIPDGTEHIDNKMFAGCHKLKSITMPPSVSSMTMGAFDGCSSLESINVDEDNRWYQSIEGVLFSRVNGKLLMCPQAKQGSFIIPDGFIGIRARAFEGCKGITHVTIPGGIKTIEANSFSGCSGLNSVSIMPGVEAVGDFAFNGCSNLKSLTLPSSVMSLGISSFSGCSSLSIVSFEGATNPCSSYVANNVFEGCDLIHHVCVPSKYDGGDFCGRTDYCLTDSCEALSFSGDRCFEETCEKGKPSKRERKNATEWKDRSKVSPCVEYGCDVVAGPVQWSMCNSTKEWRYMCINGGCLRRDQDISVEIELDRVMAGDIYMPDLLRDLKELTQVPDIEDVGLELGDQAYVIRVVVIVDSEEVGQIIVDAINNMDKTNCKYGTLCRSTYARLNVNSVHELSQGIRAEAVTMMLVFMMIVNMFLLF